MSLPVAVVSGRGAAAVRAGLPFVGRDDARRDPGPPGDVVRVEDGHGRLLGTALWADQGRIALRVLARGREVALDEALLRERIAAAAARRTSLYQGAAHPDAYRVVHGEADGLPGLFLDRYGHAVVLQTATAAMDAREGLIAAVAADVLGVDLVAVRDDGSARDLEGLPRRKGVLRAPGTSTLLRYHDAGSLVEADLLVDGKTGGFLDQQENHAAAHAYARALAPRGGARALDAFTYHGGFALALARAGLQVLACDESAAAVERARRNAALNGVEIDFQVRNAFDLLRDLEAADQRFDLIVVDPPALAKRGQGPGALTAALRGYKELNLRALRLLSPGGVLFTCSCSGRLSPADFDAMLISASRDAGAAVQVLERRGPGRDHPALLGVPETEYLKCWVLRKP